MRSLAIRVLVRSLAIVVTRHRGHFPSWSLATRVAVHSPPGSSCIHSPSGSSCVHWCLKRISFVNFFRTFVPTVFSFSHLPRWCRRTFAKHSATVLTSVWTWLSSTEVSNMWSSKVGKSGVPCVLANTAEAIAGKIPAHCGRTPPDDQSMNWTLFSTSKQIVATLGDGCCKPPRDLNNKVVMLCILCN